MFGEAVSLSTGTQWPVSSCDGVAIALGKLGVRCSNQPGVPFPPGNQDDRSLHPQEVKAGREARSGAPHAASFGPPFR